MTLHWFRGGWSHMHIMIQKKNGHSKCRLVRNPSQPSLTMHVIPLIVLCMDSKPILKVFYHHADEQEIMKVFVMAFVVDFSLCACLGLGRCLFICFV